MWPLTIHERRCNEPGRCRGRHALCGHAGGQRDARAGHSRNTSAMLEGGAPARSPLVIGQQLSGCPNFTSLTCDGR